MDTITIENGDHSYWRQSPTITIDNPLVPTFTLDTRASQTLESGVVISGKVSKWSTNSLTLELVNVGSDDGQYHEFAVGLDITDEITLDSLPPTNVTEEQQIMVDDQNDDFETFGDNIIDFTETNPFGDPNET